MLSSGHIELRLVPHVRSIARLVITILVAAVVVTFAPTLDWSGFAASEHASIPVSAQPRQSGTDPNQRLVDQLQATTARLKTDIVAGGRADLTSVALERHRLVQDLLRKEPSAVSAQLLPSTVASKGAALAPLLVERPVRLTGRYAEVHQDGVGGYASVDHHYLTVFGRSWKDAQRYELYSPDPSTFGHMHPNDSVQISGTAFGSDVLLTHAAHVAPTTAGGAAGNTVTRLFSRPAAEAATSSGTVTTGVIKTAVIAIQFVDAPTPYNMTQLHNVMQDAPNHNVVDYYNQVSYGKAQISPDFYGPYTLPSTMTVASGQCYDSSTLEQAAYQAASPYLTFANYQRIFFAINCRNASGLGSGTSYGSIGAIAISTPQGAVTAGQVFSFDTWGALRIAAHELGHNFGVGHAQYYNCQPDAFEPPTRFDLGCAVQQYADGFDIMGGQAWVQGQWDLAGEMNAQFRNSAGWLGSSNEQTLSQPGSYTVNLSPIETSTTGLQAVYVPRGTSGTGFWVFNRQPVSYDSWLTNSSYCPSCTAANGATIEFAGASDVNSYLLDTTPYSLSSNDQRDSALLAGKTFTDPEYGISITTNSTGSGGASVTVTVPSSASCVRSTPLISVTNPSLSAAPGQSVTYNVTLKNADSSTCSNNTFRTDPPSGGPGYAIVATPNVVTLAPGASASVAVTVNDPVATMTDSQSGSFTMSTCGNYTSAGCTSYSLSFTQTSAADTTAPTVPVNVSAQAVGTKQVNVTWSASTDGSAVVGYEVFRNGVQIATTPTTMLMDTSASPGVSYTYAVAAYDYKGNVSATSTSASATTATTTDTTAPSPPSGVSFTVNSAHSITISWSPSTDNVGVTRYAISGGSGYYAVPGGTTTFTDTKLAAGTRYTFYVYAYDGAGNCAGTDPSSMVVYTPKEGNAAPSQPSVIAHYQVAPTRDDVFFSPSTSSSGAVTYSYFRDNRPVGTSTWPSISDTHYPNDGYTHFDYVQSIDASGDVSQSARSYAGNMRTEGDPSDTSAPTAQLTAPAAGAGVSGSVTTTIAATDNLVVTGVELYVDGTLVGAAVPAAYSTSASLNVTWDTTLWPNGAQTVVAKAYDGLGNNIGTSPSVTVNVSNGVADTAAPTAPTNVSANAASATQVNLSWNASTDNVGVAGYYVLRNGSTVATVGNVTGWSDTSVAASTSYSYAVEAFDAVGNVSPASNTATVTTPAAADTTPPTAPAGLTATAVSSSQVNLAWSASTDNVGVAGYYVFRNGTLAATLGIVTSWSDASLAAGTSFSYQVEAFDAAGNISPASNTATATTAQATTTTSTGTIAGAVTSASTGKAISGAKVSASGNGTTTSVTTDTNGGYTLAGLTPGSYKVTVSAKGYSKKTVTASVTSGGTTIENVAM